MLFGDEVEALPETPISHEVRGYDAENRVFFGHYWMTGEARLQSPRAACVDYSAGRFVSSH